MTYYIFNSDKVCVSICEYKPSTEDCESRGESVIESNDVFDIGAILEGNGSITSDSVSKREDISLEMKANNLKEYLRLQIDKFILPTSIIGNELVTEEQKALLIQDSLLLARWPSVSNWPFVDLPELSDLTKSIIQVPIWNCPIVEEVKVEV